VDGCCCCCGGCCGAGSVLRLLLNNGRGAGVTLGTVDLGGRTPSEPRRSKFMSLPIPIIPNWNVSSHSGAIEVASPMARDGLRDGHLYVESLLRRNPCCDGLCRSQSDIILTSFMERSGLCCPATLALFIAHAPFPFPLPLPSPRPCPFAEPLFRDKAPFGLRSISASSSPAPSPGSGPRESS
jgi:hypothetical protein